MSTRRRTNPSIPTKCAGPGCTRLITEPYIVKWYDVNATLQAHPFCSTCAETRAQQHIDLGFGKVRIWRHTTHQGLVFIADMMPGGRGHAMETER